MKILVATDGSSDARAAQRLLASLPLPAGSEVLVLSAVADWTPAIDPYYGGGWVLQSLIEKEHTHAERVVEEALEGPLAELAGRGVNLMTVVTRGEAAHEIIRTANEEQVDLVVMGSKGLTGLESFLLGSVSRNVARHCRQPVLIGREPAAGLREVVFGTDGSQHALHAADFLGRFPLPESSRIAVVTAARPYSPFPGILPTDLEDFEVEVEKVRDAHYRQAESVASAAASALQAAGKSAEALVRVGDPADEIFTVAADKQADLIVVGARGASLIEGLLVGSVTDHLLKKAECSLLVVH